MVYFINPNREYPRHIGDLELAAPDWREGDPYPDGWAVVEPGTVPDVAPGERLVELAPAEIDGVWVRQFEVAK